MEQISFKVIGAVEHVPVPELTRLIELHYSHMVYHKQFDTVFDNASHERAEQYVVRSLMAGKKIMAMLLDGVIVGMIIYQRRKNVTLAGSTIYRFGITIAEECRGRNFANILTSELEKMENTGDEELWIECPVYSDNSSSIRYLEKSGYKPMTIRMSKKLA